MLKLKNTFMNVKKSNCFHFLYKDGDFKVSLNHLKKENKYKKKPLIRRIFENSFYFKLK